MAKIRDYMWGMTFLALNSRIATDIRIFCMSEKKYQSKMAEADLMATITRAKIRDRE